MADGGENKNSVAAQLRLLDKLSAPMTSIVDGRLVSRHGLDKDQLDRPKINLWIDRKVDPSQTDPVGDLSGQPSIMATAES